MPGIALVGAAVGARARVPAGRLPDSLRRRAAAAPHSGAQGGRVIVMAAMHPVQSPWTDEDRARLGFLKYLVLHGRLTDGETVDQLALERKLTHHYLPFLRTWTKQIEAAFEARRG